MAVAHVQAASARSNTSTSSITVTLGSTPTVGNVLVFVGGCEQAAPSTFDTPTGFTKLDDNYNLCHGISSSAGGGNKGLQVWYRIVESGDGTSHTVALSTSSDKLMGAIIEVSGAGVPVMRSAPFSSTSGVFFSGQNVTVESTSYALVMGFIANSTSPTITAPTGFTDLVNDTDTIQSLYVGYNIGGTTIDDLSMSNVSSSGYPSGMAVEIPEAGTTVEKWDGRNIVTVKPSGGNYTTFAAAVADTDIRNGVYEAQWASNTALTTFTSVNLGTTISNAANAYRYLHLTAAPANRHQGVAGTGHARIQGTYIRLEAASKYTRISHLEIANQIGVDIQATDNILIDNVIFNGGTTTSNTPAIEIDANAALKLCVLNCVFHGAYPTITKGAIYVDGGSSTNLSLFIDHCSINGFVQARYQTTAVVHNTWFGQMGNKYALNDENNIGGHTALGQNNVNGPYGTVEPTYWNDLTSNWIGTSALTSVRTTADAVIVTDTTSGSENYTPQKPTGSGANDILGAAINRQGYEPDPRQDFSKDIRGNNRPTVAGKIDIGAFQTGLPLPKVWNGTAFVEVNAVQVYDGTSFVDVAAIQHYDGTSFVDI